MTELNALRTEAIRRLRAGRETEEGVVRVVICLRRGDRELPVSIELSSSGEALLFSGVDTLSLEDEERALRGWLDGAGPPSEESDDTRDSVPAQIQVREPTGVRRKELGEALRDVVIAVTRLGARRAPDSPSLNTAITRVLESAPKPVSLGLARWVGRLARSLDRGEAGVTASVLMGAELAAAALLGEGDEHAEERVLAWAPSLSGDAVRLKERFEAQTMLEVGREWSMGLKRRSLERRYLLNLDTGELVREQRRGGDTPPSAGPCPREIDVDLGLISPGAPRRIQLMQYKVRMGISTSAFEQAMRAAKEDFVGMADLYRDAVERWPSLGEPVVLLCPKSAGAKELVGASGVRLPLSDEAQGAVGDLLAITASEADACWVLVRLVTREGKLCAAPLSVGVRQGAATRLVRLT